MKKKVHLEFLRIIAIIMVIFNHTGKNGFYYYSITEYSVFYPIYFFCSVACKIAVPLFWMISGALLIEKQESIGKIYKKRIFRMVITLLVFSIIQYIYMLMSTDVAQPSLFYFFKRLYEDRWAVTYGYIYSYIGMLIMLPFIRKLAKNMSRSEYIYLFLLALIVNGVIPISQYVIGNGELHLNNRIFASMFSAYMIYFIAGYYFEKIIKKDELSGKKTAGFLIVGIISVVLTCLITKYMTNKTGLTGEGDSQMFYNSLILIPTCSVYYSVRYLFTHMKIGEKINKLLVVAGNATFGIMLIENILRERLLFIFYIVKPFLHTFLACILWVICVYIVGTCITLILKKVPGIKKII